MGVSNNTPSHPKGNQVMIPTYVEAAKYLADDNNVVIFSKNIPWMTIYAIFFLEIIKKTIQKCVFACPWTSVFGPIFGKSLMLEGL